MNRLLCAFLVFGCLSGIAVCQATENLLYSFGANSTDGMFPSGGLLFDAAGNIYGVTSGGGAYCENNGGCGTVYELSPSVGGSWTESVLYNFCPSGGTCSDGLAPVAGLIMDGSGNLYGTTIFGGRGDVGTVFKLVPNGNGTWTHTVLWDFSASKSNGSEPGYGKLNMDAAGNIYGTTVDGGRKGFGTVFELSPQAGGTYSFSLLHSFSGDDGVNPLYGVAIDGSGNFYGTTQAGGLIDQTCPDGCGVIYKLSSSSGSWQETVLYKFNGISGASPTSPITLDKSGNLYGTFENGGQGTCANGACGGVFKMTPELGGRKYVFYFTGGQNGGEPRSGVILGKGNTIYGTTYDGGLVYMLNGEKETILCTCGTTWGTISTRDGALYGNSFDGGLNGLGSVYSLTR